MNDIVQEDMFLFFSLHTTKLYFQFLFLITNIILFQSFE